MLIPHPQVGRAKFVMSEGMDRHDPSGLAMTPHRHCEEAQPTRQSSQESRAFVSYQQNPLIPSLPYGREGNVACQPFAAQFAQ
jgi:hypothetical protein